MVAILFGESLGHLAVRPSKRVTKRRPPLRIIVRGLCHGARGSYFENLPYLRFVSSPSASWKTRAWPSRLRLSRSP